MEASEDVKDEDDDEQSPRSPLRSNGSYSRRAVCGTPGYMAPELMSGDPYSYPVDAWAIGCVMYQLLIGVVCHFLPGVISASLCRPASVSGPEVQ